MVKLIYMDESGFTGNDLLNSDQEFFSYAATDIDECTASQIIDSIRSAYSIKSKELKFKLINKRNNRKPGKHEDPWLYEQCRFSGGAKNNSRIAE